MERQIDPLSGLPLPEGMKLRPDGTAYYAGVDETPVPVSGQPRNFDERLRRYYGEDMSGSYNPFKPLVRGLTQGVSQEVGGLVDFGEWASGLIDGEGSDYLQELGGDIAKFGGDIPMRKFSENIYDGGKWTGLKDPTEFGGYAMEVLGQLVGQFAPYVAAVLIPEPSSSVAGAAGIVGKVTSGLGKAGKALGIAGSPAKKITAAAVGMIPSSIGRAQRGIREEIGEENRAVALLTGTGIGLLNRLPLKGILNSSSGKNYWTDIVKSFVNASVAEGVTESLQEGVQLGGNKLASIIADKTYDLVNENNLIRILDAGVAGALGGGLAGGIGAAGNYKDVDLSAKDDDKLTSEVIGRFSGKDSPVAVQKAVQTTVYDGHINSLQNALNDPERDFNPSDVEAFKSVLSSIDATNIEDSVKKDIKARYEPLVRQAESRRRTQEEQTPEQEAASQTLTAATELRQEAERNAGIEPTVEVEPDDELNVNQQALDEAGRNVTVALPNELAPYNTVGQGLNYSVGTKFDHTVNFGKGPMTVIAEVTAVDEQGTPTEAKWQNFIVTGSVDGTPVGYFDAQSIQTATEPEVAGRRMQDPVTEAKAQKEFQKAAEAEPKLKKVEVEAMVSKLGDQFARSSGFKGGATKAEGVEQLQEKQLRRERLGQLGALASGSKLADQLKQLDENRAKDKADKEAKAAKAEADRLKRDRAANKGEGAQTGKRQPVTTNIDNRLDFIRSKKKEAENEISAGVRKASTATRNLVDTNKVNMMLFLPPVKFDELKNFVSGLVDTLRGSLKYAWYSVLEARYANKKIAEGDKEKAPITKVLKQAEVKYKRDTNAAVYSQSTKHLQDPAQYEAVRNALFDFFRVKADGMGKAGFKWANLLNDKGEIDPEFVKWFESASRDEFLDWVDKNKVQLPTDQGSDVITVPNSDKTKNVSLAASEAELVSKSSLSSPNDGLSTASKIYKKDGTVSDTHISFRVYRNKKAVFINAVDGVGKMEPVYRLKQDIADKLAADKFKGKSGGFAFIHVPRNIIWNSEGTFNEENWVRHGKETSWSFSTSLPHTSLDIEAIHDQVSGWMTKLGSERTAKYFKSLARGESSNDFPINIFQGYIEFARTHGKYDKEHGIKNIFDEEFQRLGGDQSQVGGMNTKNLTLAFRASVRALAHRAKQDYQRALAGADIAAENVIEMEKGMDGKKLYRRFRNDPTFKRIVLDRVDVEGKPLLESSESYDFESQTTRGGLPLRNSYDYLIFYRQILDKKLDKIQRDLNKGDITNKDAAARRKPINEYIEDLDKSLERVKKLDFADIKNENIEKESERGTLRTVGSYPLLVDVDKHSNMRKIEKFLSLTPNSLESKQLEMDVFQHTRSIYTYPIESESKKFEKEFAKLYEDSYRDKLQAGQLAEAYQEGAEITPSWTEGAEGDAALPIVNYERDESGPDLDEMAEVVSREMSPEDQARKQLLGDVTASYTNLINSPERDMDRIRRFNAVLITIADEVGRVVYNNERNNSLKRSVSKSTEILLADLDNILRRQGVIVDKDKFKGFSPDVREAAESVYGIDAFEKFLTLIARGKPKPVIYKHVENNLEQADKAKKVLFTDIEEGLPISRLRKKHGKTAKQLIDRVISDNDAKVENEKEDALYDVDVTAEDFSDFKKKYEKVFDEIAKKNIYANYKDKDLADIEKHDKYLKDYNEAMSILAMFHNTTRWPELENHINKLFSGITKENLISDKFALAVANNITTIRESMPESDIEKISKTGKILKLRVGAAGSMARKYSTPYKAIETFVKAESAKSSKINKQRDFFNHIFRLFQVGQRFRGNAQGVPMFSNLLKLLIEFNETHINDEFDAYLKKEENKFKTDTEMYADEMWRHFHYTHRPPSSNRDVNAVVLFAKFKTLLENKDDIESLVLNSPEWSRDDRILSEDGDAADWLDSEKAISDRATAFYASNNNNIAVMRSEYNRVMRRKLLGYLLEDMVFLGVKASGQRAEAFKRLVGLKADRQAEIVNEIDDQIEVAQGAYGVKLENGRYDNSGENIGAFELFSELFETDTAFASVPKDFRRSKRLLRKSGKASYAGKFISGDATARLDGKIEGFEQSDVEDVYEPLIAVTGADGIRKSLNDYYYLLPDGAAQEGLDLLDSIPSKFFEDVDFEISRDFVSGNVRLAGAFFELNGRLKAAVNASFKDQENSSDVVAHELTHSLFSFLSANEVNQIRTLREDALKKLARGASGPEQQVIAARIMNDFNGDISTLDYAREIATDAAGTFSSAIESIAPLINDSEYFVYLMTNEGKVTQFDKLPAAHRGFLRSVFEKVKEIFTAILNSFQKKESVTKELKKDILKKFNDGTFSARLQLVSREVAGKFERIQEVERAVRTDFRDGLNPVAGRQVALEASAPSKLLEGIILKAMNTLSLDDQWKDQLLDEEGNLITDSRVAVLAKLKRNREINQFLTEQSSISGMEALNPTSYLELMKDKNELDDSVWKQVSKNTALSLEYFVNEFQRLKSSLESMENPEGKHFKQTVELFSKVSKGHIGKTEAAEIAKATIEQIKAIGEQNAKEARQNETAKFLEELGFTVTSLSSQLDLSEKGESDLTRIVDDMYATLSSTAEGRQALFLGKIVTEKESESGELVKRSRSMKPRQLANLYKRIKDNESEVFSTDYDSIKAPRKKSKFNLTPMHRIAAWKVFNQQKISRQEMGLAAEISDDFAVAQEEYYQMMQDPKLGAKGATSKLLNDLVKVSREEGVHARTFLSARRALKARMKKISDTRLAVNILEEVMKDNDFITARNEAIQEVNFKPAVEIKYDGANINLPNPGGETTQISMDVSTSSKLTQQLAEIDVYIERLNKWVENNQNHHFRPFWENMRDHVSALLNANTIRAGLQSKNFPDFLKQLFKPMDNVLTDIGGYAARVSRQELYNYVEISEKSEDWRRNYEQKIINDLYAAAESHGYAKDNIGVAKWHEDIGQEFMAMGAKVGRKLDEGDSIYVDGEAVKITKADVKVLNKQAEYISQLYELNLKQTRGNIAEPRKVEEQVRGKDGQLIFRDPIAITETTLPKTFRWSSVLFAQKVNDAFNAVRQSVFDVDNAGLPEDIAREVKLNIWKQPMFDGESIQDLIVKEDKFISAFLGDREGNITSGTNPYFSENIYDGAKLEKDKGNITNMRGLAAYFANRSVEMNKIDEDGETDYQLSVDAAEYELTREMLRQITNLNKRINPNDSSGLDAGISNDIKIVVLKDRNSFNMARQEAIANWFFYDYGIKGTTGLSKMVSDSSSQYLDRFTSSLDGIVSYLQGARKDLAEQTTQEIKKKNYDGEVFVRFDQIQTDLNKIQALKKQLEDIQTRDVRFEQAINQGALQVGLRDMVGLALQSIVTGVRNLLGTPLRTQLRLQAIFGMSPVMHVSGVINTLKGMLEGAATLSYGLTTGGFSAAKTLIKGEDGKRLKPAMKKFIQKSFDEAWVKEATIRQFKINETFKHISDMGYGMRVDAATKFDNWWTNPATRGRIEREEEIERRQSTKMGKTKHKLIEMYNRLAFFGPEFFGNIGPRMFDMVGNNISYRGANVAARMLDTQLKKLHSDYQNSDKSLWDDYNDPDLPYGNKRSALIPEHVFSNRFLFKATNNQLKLVEDLFGQAGLDFHREALQFLKRLDSDKNAQFLSDDALGKLGVAMFSENASTLASRSIEFRTDPTKNLMFQLWGWGLGAYYNSLTWLGRSIKGNPNWASREGVRFQQAVALAGFLTLSAGGTAATEELIRRLKKLLFNEVANNRHPWEEEENMAAARRWGVYAMAAFPVMNIPANLMLSDTGSTTATGGVDLFYQSAIKRTFSLAYGSVSTGQWFPPYQWDIWIKSTMPNPAVRAVVNSVVDGHLAHTNNKRMLQMFSDPAYRKSVGGYYSGVSANPVSAHVRNMVNYATSGDFENFAREYRLAVADAVELEKEDPDVYVRNLYWARDPYRLALKGKPPLSLRTSVLEQIEKSYGEDDRDDFLVAEANFNRGYRMMGGTSSRFDIPKGTSRIPKATRTTRQPRSGRRSRSSAPSYQSTVRTLRRAYGV